MVAANAVHSSVPAHADFANGQIAAYTLLLETDVRSHATGSPLLTDHGTCYVRQLLACLRTGRSNDVAPILPHWDGELLQLWLGEALLKTFGHRESHQTA